MDNIDTKLVDTSIFTSSDAIQAAQSIFSNNHATFEEIKTRSWYKKLLNAIAGGHKDRKHLHRSIRDLAQLQELVMNIYITQMQSYDSDFAQVVDQLINTNSVVGKLYKSCVLKINQQPEIQVLSDSDQELMYIFLGIYAKESELTPAQKDRLRNYNSAIASNLRVLPPESARDFEAFEKVENADVFYRCAIEQCAVTTEKLTPNPFSAIDYLNISPRRKSAICATVEEELSTFGFEHFWLKYQKYDLWEDTIVDYEVSENEICNLDNSKEFTIAPNSHIDVTKDCATAVFRAVEIQDKNQFIESASYVVFNDSNKISYFHKETAIKKTIDVEVGDVKALFDKKQIATYHDVLCYLMGNDVFFYDLDSQKNKLMAHLPEVSHENQTVEISNISFTDSKIVYYCSGLNIYDVISGERVSVKVPEETFGMGDTSEYILIGENIFYLANVYTENKKGKDLVGNVLCKYCITNDLATLASEPFALNSMMDYLIDTIHFGAFNDIICIVVEYSFIEGNDRSGVTCVYIDTKNDRNVCSNFYIWTPFIYNIRQYNNRLVYVNAAKDYAIISHDFITDKKSVLVKNHGYTEKTKLSDRLLLGKGFYQHPEDYTLIGKWICYHDKQYKTVIVSAV